MRQRFDHNDFEAHNSYIQLRLQTLLLNGQIMLHGRQYTYERVKQAGMPVVRDRMFKILKELDPGGLTSRPLHFSTRPRGAYTVPGPNFVWSIDGYHKLSMYGIEIYAGIDVFSRYVYFYSFLLFQSLCMVFGLVSVSVDLLILSSIHVLEVIFSYILDCSYNPLLTSCDLSH